MMDRESDKRNEKRAFSPEEIARLVGVSKMTVYREIRRGKLPAVQLGRIYIITRPDIEQWLGKERARAMLGEMDTESNEWLSTTAFDTADRLDDLEADLAPEELEAWQEAMAQVSKPARYIPGKGVVVEENV